mmetsp:Transcript_18362/g.38374  ORF Transcript_18362/g.38374 Transcript_18362/m.38374 type:complete len:296 (-) Transcript_18362:1034-1921(-)
MEEGMVSPGAGASSVLELWSAAPCFLIRGANFPSRPSLPLEGGAADEDSTSASPTSRGALDSSTSSTTTPDVTSVAVTSISGRSSSASSAASTNTVSADGSASSTSFSCFLILGASLPRRPSLPLDGGAVVEGSAPTSVTSVAALDSTISSTISTVGGSVTITSISGRPSSTASAVSVNTTSADEADGSVSLSCFLILGASLPRRPNLPLDGGATVDGSASISSTPAPAPDSMASSTTSAEIASVVVTSVSGRVSSSTNVSSVRPTSADAAGSSESSCFLILGASLPRRPSLPLD